MLFPDKSFYFFEINAWPLLRKNFTILTQNIKPVEKKWKDTGFIVNIMGCYSRYLEDSSFCIISKRTECFYLTNHFALLR